KAACDKSAAGTGAGIPVRRLFRAKRNSAEWIARSGEWRNICKLPDSVEPIQSDRGENDSTWVFPCSHAGAGRCQQSARQQSDSAECESIQRPYRSSNFREEHIVWTLWIHAGQAGCPLSRKRSYAVRAGFWPHGYDARASGLDCRYPHLVFALRE